MEKFEIIEETFRRISIKVLNVKQKVVLNSEEVVSSIDASFSLEPQIYHINRFRQLLLDKLNRAFENKHNPFENMRKESRIYLRGNQNSLTSLSIPSLLDQFDYLRISNDLKLFQKFRYFQFFNCVQEISLADEMGMLKETYKFDQFTFYLFSETRFLIKDNDNNRLLIFNKKLKLLHTKSFNKSCSCWHLNVVQSRIVFTLFDTDSKNYFIYVLDSRLNLINRRKLSKTRTVYVGFCENNIYYSCPLSSNYILLDLNLNVMKEFNLNMSASVLMHSLSERRVILQNNMTREIQVFNVDKERIGKENSMLLIRAIKLDKFLCVKMFLDTDLNVYMLEKSLADNLIYLVCYNLNGSFLFRKLLPIFNDFKNLEILKNDQVYFSNNYYVKRIV